MFELYDLNPDQTPTLALWRTLLVPEDRERTDRELAALLANPKPFVMEFRITTRGGKLRHIRGEGQRDPRRSGPAAAHDRHQYRHDRAQDPR